MKERGSYALLISEATAMWLACTENQERKK
jgi:hypothetical protein